MRPEYPRCWWISMMGSGVGFEVLQPDKTAPAAHNAEVWMNCRRDLLPARLDARKWQIGNRDFKACSFMSHGGGCSRIAADRNIRAPGVRKEKNGPRVWSHGVESDSRGAGTQIQRWPRIPRFFSWPRARWCWGGRYRRSSRPTARPPAPRPWTSAREAACWFVRPF